MDLYYLLFLVLGAIVGFLFGWFFVARAQGEMMEETERHWQGRLDAAYRELQSANEDNLEIKERILALQDEHQGCTIRIEAAEGARVDAETRLHAAEERASEAQAAKTGADRELDRARNALAHERARMEDLRSEFRRLEQAATIAGSDRAGSERDGSTFDADASASRTTMPESFMSAASPSHALHEDALEFEHARKKAAPGTGANAGGAGGIMPAASGGVGSMASLATARMEMQPDSPGSSDMAQATAGDDNAGGGWTRSGSGGAFFTGHGDAEGGDSRSTEGETGTAGDAAADRRRLRKLEQKIAQLPAGSTARQMLADERQELIRASGGELARRPSPQAFADMPSPSMALHESQSGFVHHTPASAVAPLLSEAERGERRRIRTLDAKIAQLPAGSAARRRLEAERTGLSGGQVMAAGSTEGAEIASPVGTASAMDVSGDASGETTMFRRPVGSPDDLKKIKGIGPKLERKLHSLGITRFDQVAAFTRDDIERVDNELDFKGRIHRENWIGQARDLAHKSR